MRRAGLKFSYGETNCVVCGVRFEKKSNRGDTCCHACASLKSYNKLRRVGEKPRIVVAEA